MTTAAAYEPANKEHPPPRFPKKQLIYIAVLVGLLLLIEQDTEQSVFDAVQQHEPSIRIFRSLLETVLLLIGAAASFAIYCRYLGRAVTADLLFQPAAAAASPEPQGLHKDDDNEDDDDLFEKVEEEKDDHKPPKQQQQEDNNQGDIELPEVVPKEEEEEEELSKEEDGLSKDTVQQQLQEHEDETTLVNNIPSPVAILNGALDFFVWILIALVFYTLAAVNTGSSNSSNDDDEYAVLRMLSRIAAPTFPLLLFLYAVFKAVYPWNKTRSSLVQIVSYTVSAPAFAVTFRDGMIGDILTSTVRPMQDIAFTVFYILFGLRGWWSSNYYYSIAEDPSQTQRQFITEEQQSVLVSSTNSFLDAADASVPDMERSWIVHTVVLPACMISPLWWRFLQNMRQTYDSQQRWPFLANALKYFVAAQVAMVGVYHPHLKQSAVWLTSFVVATLYQVWYDVFLDWGLLVRNPDTGGWQLRSKRLYPRKSMYWSFAIINLFLRFCWTLSFVPMRYLSAAGVLTNNFSGATWSSILASTIASAEIIRRTLWGLLRVEWEAIKVQGGQQQSDEMKEEGDGLKMTPMSGGGSSSLRRFGIPLLSDMTSMNNVQILVELGMYTTIFAVLGLVAAAHRETL